MQKLRPHILFFLLTLMLAGLFFSRALLAVSMIVFVVASLLHKNYKLQFREFLKQPLCWGTSLLFLLPFISGLWSDDKSQWIAMMQVKLPLLLFPLAFAWPLGFSERYWRWLLTLLIMFLLGGIFYSLINYSFLRSFYDLGYLRGNSILTPLDNDHVRFSLMVFMGIVFCGLQYHKDKEFRYAWLWIFIMILFIIYLHILASRTGLLAFYFSAAGWVIYLLLKLKRRMAITMVSFLILIPLAAWFLLPSFQNKIRLFKFESDYFIHGSYTPFSNDIVRIISIRAGWSLLKAHPIQGTGYGDIIKDSREWYSLNYSEMIEEDKIYPSSQFLVFGAGTGFGGLIIFCLVLFLPFFIAMANPVPWRMILSGLAISYLFDIGLEVQFGVFIHCFFLFLSWQWMKRQNIASL